MRMPSTKSPNPVNQTPSSECTNQKQFEYAATIPNNKLDIPHRATFLHPYSERNSATPTTYTTGANMLKVITPLSVNHPSKSLNNTYSHPKGKANIGAANVMAIAVVFVVFIVRSTFVFLCLQAPTLWAKCMYSGGIPRAQLRVRQIAAPLLLKPREVEAFGIPVAPHVVTEVQEKRLDRARASPLRDRPAGCASSKTHRGGHCGNLEKLPSIDHCDLLYSRSTLQYFICTV